MAKRYVNVIQRKPNLWMAKLVFPFDKNLGHKPTTKYFYGRTAAEADKKRKAYKPEKESVDKETTLLAYIRDTFLPHQKAMVAAGQLSYAFYERRKGLLTRFFIAPENKQLKEHHLRKIALGNLQPVHIKGWFQTLSTVKMSDEYRYRLKSDMRAVLMLAEDRIPEEVVDYFKGVKVSSLPGRRNSLVLFDPQDIYGKITDDSLPVEDRALVAMPFILNRRPSEIFALQWDDVDLDNGTAYVRHKVERRSGGTFEVVDGTKTGSKGIRLLPLGPELQVLLIRLREQRNNEVQAWEEQIDLKVATLEDRIRRMRGHRNVKLWRKEIIKLQQQKEQGLLPFIFLTKQEKARYNTQNFKKNWPKIKEALGLPNGPTYYSLKHLGNSYALANGVTPEAQAWKMGHTSPKMAMEVYREIMGAEKIKTVSIYSKLSPAQKEMTTK